MNHKSDGHDEEVEAHWFAAELLAPEIIINEIKKESESNLDVFDIQEIFHISYEASCKRVNSLNRKCSLNPYLESETIQKYRDKINKCGFVFCKV